MADVMNEATRHRVMANIGSKNTLPEILVRSFLHRVGFRFRLHVSSLPGTPDIVLKRFNTVVFINGCFWHGHQSCKYSRLPSTRTDWWKQKINNTVKRDADYIEKLRADSWNVIVIWTCAINKTKSLNRIAELPNIISGQATKKSQLVDIG
ncbi:MAG: DNA mismatch endonuclease Vsr [Sphingobacteriales bacterium]|nr:MAG: DNA mismatch endonuclease Vsr [Sphingobacteriales bacterium]